MSGKQTSGSRSARPSWHQAPERTLTEEQAWERLIYWKRILRLEDWDILVKIVPHWEADFRDVNADVSFVLVKRYALIKLVNPEHTTPGPVPPDMELSLVHELMHVMMAGMGGDDHTETAEEQAAHFLSTALVQLDRARRPNAKLEEG